MRRTLAFICKKPCPFQRLNRFVGFETYGSASAAILPSLPDDVPALVDAFCSFRRPALQKWRDWTGLSSLGISPERH